MERWIIVAIDPICGMTVDEATAPHAEKEWRTYYFCSDQCRQKFLASGPSNTKQPGLRITTIMARRLRPLASPSQKPSPSAAMRPFKE